MFHRIIFGLAFVYAVLVTLPLLFTMRDSFAVALTLHQAGANMIPTSAHQAYAAGWLMERIK